jgi:hypothetical protein
MEERRARDHIAAQISAFMIALRKHRAGMKAMVTHMGLKEVLKKNKRGDIHHVSLQMEKSILSITESGLSRIIHITKYAER